ncbi:hypothetical protein [Gluconobacter morbifer]|uniref:OmpA-like domain-containing protein n=1 Tax=Gluconobacter morbifer G707 TaxID=1088869 RepID=G6XKP7_9PROT|nr:hypothetical protein [Gluconobacter morbifer]EHH67610.1 hypothetical protein GMO_20630 [Gluconobacter morbifer G707]
MYRPILSFLPLAAVLACFPLSDSSAQVTSNLDDLPQSKPASPAPAHKTAQHAAPARHASSKTRQPAPAHPTHTASGQNTSASPAASPFGTTTAARPQPARTTVPAVPAAPPPPVVLPPPFVPIQTHAPVPPMAVPAVPDAKSSTAPLPDDGLRVLFAPNDSSLNEASLKAISAYGVRLAARPDTRVILRAYATLPGDDISMPRRISLARVLAIRSVLIHADVATTRIYPRALGRPDKGDTAPGDRLDITLETNPAPTAAPASATPANGMP